MKLRKTRIVRRDWRNDGALEGPSRDHYAIGLDRAPRCFDGEALAPRIAHDLLHFHAGADRRFKLLRISDEIVRDLLLRREGVGVKVGELEIGETIVPGGAIGNQRIPASRAPALGDTSAFQHEMRHAKLAQMFAHGDAGLTGADYGRVD